MSGRAKLSYKGSSAVSTLEIISEQYSHDVSCTFHVTGADGVAKYSGLSRIIVYSESVSEMRFSLS